MSFLYNHTEDSIPIEKTPTPIIPTSTPTPTPDPWLEQLQKDIDECSYYDVDDYQVGEEEFDCGNMAICLLIWLEDKGYDVKYYIGRNLEGYGHGWVMIDDLYIEAVTKEAVPGYDPEENNPGYVQFISTFRENSCNPYAIEYSCPTYPCLGSS